MSISYGVRLDSKFQDHRGWNRPMVGNDRSESEVDKWTTNTGVRELSADVNFECWCRCTSLVLAKEKKRISKRQQSSFLPKSGK